MTGRSWIILFLILGVQGCRPLNTNVKITPATSAVFKPPTSAPTHPPTTVTSPPTPASSITPRPITGATAPVAPVTAPTQTPTGTPPILSAPSVACATVDGVTDNTQCLQTALQSTSPSADGLAHVVLKPNLTYSLQGVLTIPANTIFDGSNSTILVPPSFSRQWLNFISISGSHVTIQNLVFNYAGIPAAPAGAAPLTYGCNAIVWGASGISYTTIQNVTITGANLLFAINLSQSALTNINILNSTIHDVGGYGIIENSNRVTPADIDSNIVISGNTFTNLGADGIEFNDAVFTNGSGDPNLVSKNITISNNVISNAISTSPASGFCIGIAGAKYVTITGNTLSNCSWQGIHLEDTAGYITIQNNTIHDIVRPANYWVQDTAGIALGGMQVDILNNVIYNVPLGIDVIWGSTSTVPPGDTGNFTGYLWTNNIIMAGNTFSNWTNYAVRIGGSSDQTLNDTLGPVQITGQPWSSNNNLSFGPNVYNGTGSAYCFQGSASGVKVTDTIQPGC